MGNDNEDDIPKLDDEKEPQTPSIEPDLDLVSYEEKGLMPEKETKGSNSDESKIEKSN